MIVFISYPFSTTNLLIVSIFHINLHTHSHPRNRPYYLYVYIPPVNIVIYFHSIQLLEARISVDGNLQRIYHNEIFMLIDAFITLAAHSRVLLAEIFNEIKY